MNRPRQNLSFVYRPAKDEPAVTESDLSRQLHSSVRTPNLETSLRLLSQGADPNYYHPEKNSTPLQVRFTLQCIPLIRPTAIRQSLIHCISVIPLSDTARNRIKGGF